MERCELQASGVRTPGWERQRIADEVWCVPPSEAVSSPQHQGQAMLLASTSLVFMTARFTQRSDGCCLLERLRVHRPGPYGPRLTQQMALRSERNGTSRRYDSVRALSPTETVCRTPHPTLSPRAPAAQEGRVDKFSDRLVVSLPVMVFRANRESEVQELRSNVMF